MPTASGGNTEVCPSRPVRSTRGTLPNRYKDFDLSSLLVAASEAAGSFDDPQTFRDAINSSDKDHWQDIGENIINWEARKQRCTALSSTEAEYLAISDVCKHICFVTNFLREIVDKNFDVTVFNDNQSAQRLLLVKEYSHKRTKHIDLRYHFVKDLVQEKQINIKYLPTDQMIADVLTKPLCSQKHINFVNNLALRYI